MKIPPLFLGLFLPSILFSQTVDYSNCAACSPSNLALFDTINLKYLGVAGSNPDVSSTYNLIGDNKFSGTLHDLYGVFLQNNWYPIRTPKQIFCGKIIDFGVANYGDESDWNIHLLPNPDFGNFITDALEFKKDNWYAFGPLESQDEWKVTSDGRYTVEAEITPPAAMFNNDWFNNNDSHTDLMGKEIGVYGSFVAEESHGMKPEIHPSEQLWWKQKTNQTIILLVGDASNRFDDMTDFEKYSDVVEGYKPWAQNSKQLAEMSIPFEIDVTRKSLYYSIQALAAHNFYAAANYEDATSGNKHTIVYNSQSVLTIEESPEIAAKIGVTFRNVCFSSGKLRGLIVLSTAVGNGANGKQGFVALQLDKEEVGSNEQAAIVTGNIIQNNNQWTTYTSYDDAVLFGRNIISSDKEGKGIVDGMIDFNGNGKTDLFTSVNGRWMVLFDAQGRWQEINTSNVAQADLRFGDVNGDGNTDILYVDGARKVQVSYSGTGRWTQLTDAGEQTALIQVGDFNGDNKTDIVYFKYRGISAPWNWPIQVVKRIADMYVKYSCTGSWIELNNGYELEKGEYEKNFRFGNFNGDNITDIFRYNDNKFKVYYNGRGNIQLLSTPLINSINLNDLLFVENLSSVGYTDIIYIKRSNLAWKIYYKGRTTESGRILKYNDPSNVHFGNLDEDALWEPFTKDFVTMRKLPEDIRMKDVAPAIIEPMILYKYEKGSLKRGTKNNKPVLEINMHAIYHPGSGSTTKRKESFRGPANVRLRSDMSQLSFTSVDKMVDGREAIGIIQNIPLSRNNDARISVKYPSVQATDNLKLPAYGISAFKSKVNESILGTGSLEKWRRVVSTSMNTRLQEMFRSVPGNIRIIDSVSWELLPFYSSIENKKVSSVEVPEPLKELNEIIYANNPARITELYGSATVFTIEWTFELSNLSTGQAMEIINPNNIISNGKWVNNKINFRFPANSDLLQFSAKAVIKDSFGTVTLNPIVYLFFNQQIHIPDVKNQVKGWINGLTSITEEQQQQLLRRAYRVAADGVINPIELKGLLK